MNTVFCEISSAEKVMLKYRYKRFQSREEFEIYKKDNPSLHWYIYPPADENTINIPLPSK